jgi:hypothetical protein
MDAQHDLILELRAATTDRSAETFADPSVTPCGKALTA